MSSGKAWANLSLISCENEQASMELSLHTRLGKHNSLKMRELRYFTMFACYHSVVGTGAGFMWSGMEMQLIYPQWEIVLSLLISIVDRRYWLSLGVIYFDDNIQSI